MVGATSDLLDNLCVPLLRECEAAPPQRDEYKHDTEGSDRHRLHDIVSPVGGVISVTDDVDAPHDPEQDNRQGKETGGNPQNTTEQPPRGDRALRPGVAKYRRPWLSIGRGCHCRFINVVCSATWR